MYACSKLNFLVSVHRDGEDDEGDFDEIGDIVEIHEAEKKRADEKAKIDAYSNQEILTPPQAKAHLAGTSGLSGVRFSYTSLKSSCQHTSKTFRICRVVEA